MAPLKCCVGGCTATSESHRLFRLPQDDNLRSLWMSFLVPTNPLLLGLTKEQLTWKHVCHKHFDRYQLNQRGARARYAYPCLFSENEIAHGVPLCSEEYSVLSEHNYHKEREEDNEDARAAPMLAVLRTDDDELVEHSYSTCSSSLGITVSIVDTKEMVKAHEIPSCSYGEISKISSPKSTLKGKAMTPSCSMAKERKTASAIPTRKKRVSSIKRKWRSQKRKDAHDATRISSEILQNTGFEKLNEGTYHEFFKNFDLLSKASKTVLAMQLKLASTKKMGRRFDMEEKLIALTLMKQSPKGYRLLEKMFVLPNKRTLNRLSRKICFETGINLKVFKYIKETTKNWDIKKKLCTITFDEVALTPNLTFNEAKDVIDGFVELGGEKKLKYCDHALVFMIRGICSAWRQSLVYYFCEGTVSSPELVQILKEIVKEVASTGLTPLGLVCDQGATFRSALRHIRQDTIRLRSTQGIRDYGNIEIAGLDLNIFYDPPHLLKSIRNNFVTKDLLLDGTKIGSWKDIMFIFDIDSKLGHTRTMPKLTAHHVIPSKIKKMKVSAATQVLSARTAAMLKYTNALSFQKDGRGKTMAATAEIVEFFDTLFDSVNGAPGRSKRGKLRCAVKENSPHLEFWQEAIKKLKNIKFIDNSSKVAIQSGKPRHVRVPCLEGWVTTLESFIRLSKLLRTKYGVDYFYPRYVNQDPLENFFGRIRAINYRNVNPDAYTFINSFKALVMSIILNPHSQFSNCEDDKGDTLINLSFLFENENSNKENVSEIPSPLSPQFNQTEKNYDDLQSQVTFEKIRVPCSAYTAGYLCRKITKSINCKTCRKTYSTTEIDSIHKYIEYREYKNLKRSNLVYPNGNFLRLYREAAQCIHSYLNIYCYKKYIKKNLKYIMIKKLGFSWLGCKKHHHDVVDKFCVLILRMQVHNWCKIINRILKGDVEERYVKKMNEPQKMAYRKYCNIRLRKKVLNK